jgi:hypothetical protein
MCREDETTYQRKHLQEEVWKWATGSRMRRGEKLSMVVIHLLAPALLARGLD